MAANRYKYPREELEQYFNRICLPEKDRVYDIATLPNDEDKLAFLTLLQKHQLVSIPWENLTQHYSWHRVVNVKPAHLFRKIVLNDQGTGRGGYCMEANSLWHYVLVSLGFDVYIAGSRIYSGTEEGGYGGWTHMVNLVTIAGVKYLLDGGFGPQEATQPLPLKVGDVQAQIPPAQSRLLHEPIPQMRDQSQRVWIYQHRYDESAEWKTMYCFTELEFLPSDIESMNFAPWLSKQTFFTHTLVCVRFTTSGESDPGREGTERIGGLGSGKGEVDGSLTLNQDVLKWRRRGEKVLEWKFKTEDERVGALAKYFGIELKAEDREAIDGTASAIGPAGATGDGE